MLRLGVLGNGGDGVTFCGFGCFWGYLWIMWILECLWDFAPLVVFWSLIICVIVFYDVFLCCVVVLFKLLIMSVSNLLVILLVGDSGGMEYFS